MEDDNIPRRAYPKNGRKRGRPKGIPNPNGGRPKGSKTKKVISRISSRAQIAEVASQECRALLELRAKAITEAVLNEEMRLAFSDIRLIPGCPQDIPDEIAYAIQSFEVDERVIKSLSDDSDQVLVARRTKFTLWPKGAALERLSRQYGLYEKDNIQKPKTTPQVNIYLEQGGINMMARGPQLPGADGDADGP